MAIVTLLTDFGLDDTYVGQVRGAILGVCPAATIVDLTHAVPPQDVFAGAFLLWSAVAAFPTETVHLAVVDPGVGSRRRALAMRARAGHVLVGPDNGLLWPATQRLGGCDLVVALPPPGGVSSTFHGRDIFAPAAGRLARGARLDDLGAPIDDPVVFELPQPAGESGQVLHVDRYGNLVTNFPREALPGSFTARVGQFDVAPAGHYAEAEPGALLAVVGSTGLLEISVRDGSAAALTGARRGTPVLLQAR